MYDVSRRSPKWVVEHLRKPEVIEVKEDKEGKTKRDGHAQQEARRRHRPPFHPEQAIDVRKFRTSPAMYKNTGYDRGERLSLMFFIKLHDASFTTTESLLLV
jgi:DNA/RNA endonuclease G (NUC1)